MNEVKKIRDVFLKYLTEDSEVKDARRKDFNQAIFDKDKGWAVFNGTDLDMVMDKFDKTAELISTLISEARKEEREKIRKVFDEKRHYHRGEWCLSPIKCSEFLHALTKEGGGE